MKYYLRPRHQSHTFEIILYLFFILTLATLYINQFESLIMGSWK